MKTKHRSRKSGRAHLVGLSGVLAVVVAALLLAGCGGSSGSDSSSEESSAASSEQAGGPGGFAEISDETRTCLKENGAELPEPGQGGPPAGGPPEGGPPAGGPPQGFKGGAKMKKAFEECGVELPQGKPEGTPMNSSAFRKSIKEYAACMGENGYDLPEPNVSGEGPVFSESEVDREDPKFEAANEKCESLLGGPGGPPEAG